MLADLSLLLYGQTKKSRARFEKEGRGTGVGEYKAIIAAKGTVILATETRAGNGETGEKEKKGEGRRKVGREARRARGE